MRFERELNLNNLKSSAFIFGPRMTGKTTLLNRLRFDEFFDLLDPELELQYKSQPRTFWEQISAIRPNSRIVVDEIQRVPELLNYVQMGIDRLGHHFLLSGSSARKLKRGGANLLGGRALDLKLHPLTKNEIGDIFRLDEVLRFGSLPKISSLLFDQEHSLVKGHIKSYVTTYLKEEIQAEALTRNLGAFQRFLNIAAQSNAQVIEFSNISRASSVPASTVKEYFQVLEDTLLGFFLWPFDRSERKKARPKFYFFDCGVVRAIQNRLQDPPTPQENGFLFENWLICELIRIRDYLGKDHEFSFWRRRNHEIDIIIADGHGPILAIECKSARTGMRPATMDAFRSVFPDVPLVIASMTDTRKRRINNIDILPWASLLAVYRKL